MTKPRLSPDRLLFGYLGRSKDSTVALRVWNAHFRTRGIDASMDRYPCTDTTLPERLSEMLHFDRRGYIVAEGLQSEIVRFMDRLDGTAARSGRVDTVVNDGGVLTGYDCDGSDERRKAVWLGV